MAINRLAIATQRRWSELGQGCGRDVVEEENYDFGAGILWEGNAQ